MDDHDSKKPEKQEVAASSDGNKELLGDDISRAGAVTATVTIIGGNGGSMSWVKGWEEGKVIKKIRVYSGEGTIKAYTIWLTDSGGVTFGNPEKENYADCEFEDGERITDLTLWGNGAGTRAGWIELRTSKGQKFSYGMHSWDKQTAYPVEVASGVMVGCVFRYGADIDAHGFVFLNPIANAELRNVRYPTLSFDTAGIVPKVLDRFQYNNNSTTAKDWDFTRTMREKTEETWSITKGITVHTSVTVQAGIPLVAEVESEFGWEVGVTRNYETTQTSEQEFSWSVKGTVQPGQYVDIKAVTRMGSINTEYEGTMVVKLKNGAAFSYAMKGMYKGISYNGAEVVDDSTR